MKKFWKLKSYSEDMNHEIIIDKILEQKGINTEEEKEKFLSRDIKNLSDPFIMGDMEKAVKRILEAVNKDEKILIYGDYDVDGITSTALLYHYFKDSLNKEINYFLPDRSRDGYGLNTKSIRKFAEENIDLIITVDCGISAFKEAELASELNIDLIITDHHTPGDRLPAAAAVLNHHLVDKENYEAEFIAGVGTAYKLTQALDLKSLKNSEKNDYRNKLLALTALGTVADIAPLMGENRILVSSGLKYFSDSGISGLDILLDKLKLDKDKITAGQIGYIIAPPLNAAGRIYSADKALNLLITENKKEADKIAAELIKINRERQLQEEKILKEALEKIKDIDLEKEKSIILYDKNWNSGVIGIAASRLVDKFNLPVILLAPDNEKSLAKASCRSISKLHMYKALKSCSELLNSFGGHKAAAGLSISFDNIDLFKDKFNNYLRENMSEEDYIPVVRIDLNLDFKKLNKKLINKIEALRPFGPANPRPKFLFKNLKVNNCFTMGSDNSHLKFNLEYSQVEAVAFNMGEEASKISGSTIDLIAQPEINKWKGRENLQLKVVDYRISDDNLKPIIYSNKILSFYDLRSLRNKRNAINNILSDKSLNSAAVYINKSKLKSKLSKRFPEHHFFSKISGIKADFDYLILYSLPFSMSHLKQLIDNYLSESKKIILVFSEAEARFNHKLIEHSCPTEKMLNNFFDFVKSNKDPVDKTVNLEKLKTNYLNSKAFSLKTKRLFNEMIKIIDEIYDWDLKSSFLNCAEGSGRSQKQLDFKASIRYNKLSRQMEKFINFKEEIFSQNLFILMDNVSNF